MDDLSVKIKYSLDGNSSTEVIQQTKKLEEDLQKTPIQLKIEANTGIASQEMSASAKSYEQVWEKAFFNQRTMALKTAEDIKNVYNKQMFDNFNKDIGIGTTSSNSAKASAAVFEDLFNKSKLTTAGLSDVEKQIVSLNPQFENMSNSMDHSAQSMNGMITKFAQWYLIGGAVTGVFDQIKNGVKFIDDLNKSETNIQMITGDSSGQVQQMTKDYSDLASQLHETTSSIMTASEEFLRAGNSAEDTGKLLQASTVMSKIAGQTQEESAKSLISIQNAFHMHAEDMIGVVDKMVAVDNKSATSTKELGDAMQRVSASAQEAGISLPQLISYIGTISSVTRQSAETIGTALNSIISRYQSIKEGKKFDPDNNPLTFRGLVA